MLDTEVTGLPFDEALQFFRQKLNIPTQTWRDIWRGAHAKAFMVAGAMKHDLLSDLRGAVDQAVEGGSFHDFQKAFDAAVVKHGWDFNGGRKWRAGIIYRTNLRSAYAAGRYRQMTSPGMLRRRPYWQYLHGGSENPRLQHLAWDGLVLPADDPFWSSHFPPNGWGCSCTVRTLSAGQLRREGLTVGKAPVEKTVTVTNPRTGETTKVPDGIDAGFDFNIGEAASGRPHARAIIDTAQDGDWEDVSPMVGSGPLPLDRPVASLGRRARNRAELDRIYDRTFGQAQAQFSDPLGDVITLDDRMKDHLLDKGLSGREQYLSFIEETITDPAEVYVSFARHKETGRYSLRRRYIKGLDVKKGGRSIGLVVEAVGGVWTGLTFFQGQTRGLGALRRGKRIFKRPEKKDTRS